MPNEKPKGVLFPLISFCILHAAFCIGFAAIPPRRSRRWIGFFVVLAVLAGVAISVPLVYNLSIQLRPEQLAEARRRWQEHAPPNYDLEYLVRTTNGEQQEERAYLVQVRGGRVVLVVDNGEMSYLDPSLAGVAGLAVPALSLEDPRRYGVPALFDEIETTLRHDESAGRRNFATVQFDPQDGHPFRYVHRVRGAKERVEWNIKMTRGVLSEPEAQAQDHSIYRFAQNDNSRIAARVASSMRTSQRGSSA